MVSIRSNYNLYNLPKFEDHIDYLGLKDPNPASRDLLVASLPLLFSSLRCSYFLFWCFSQVCLLQVCLDWTLFDVCFGTVGGPNNASSFYVLVHCLMFVV